MFFFTLGQLSHFPSCFGAGVTNLKEPPSSLLLPPRRCGLGAGSIPLRATVNIKQCETRGLFMSLVIHCWIGDVQDSHQGVSVSQNTNSVITSEGTICPFSAENAARLRLINYTFYIRVCVCVCISSCCCLTTWLRRRRWWRARARTRLKPSWKSRECRATNSTRSCRTRWDTV